MSVENNSTNHQHQQQFSTETHQQVNLNGEEEMDEDEERDVGNNDDNNNSSGDIIPNQTIYINNLNEKIKVPELKKQLYAMFSQFGPILDVVASRSLKMRGQAFIVFKDISTATNALRKMNNWVFHDKPMRITFAKSKSDAIAKLDGSIKEQKRKREEERKLLDGGADKTAKRQRSKDKSKQKQKGPGLGPTADMAEPNSTLFVENLPDKVHENKETIEMLFQNYDGFKEVRLIPGRKSLAFVDYDNEDQATNAMMKLQGFKITKSHPMKITYAKKG